MNFQVLGIHYKNKGALLMLEAIRSKVSNTYPNSQISICDDWPVEMLSHYNLKKASAPRKKRYLGPLLDKISNLVPRPRRNTPSASRDIDILLDASGFAYGDYWGIKKLERCRRKIAYRRKGVDKIVIMLPQAFGPFETPGIGKSFNRILDLATLVFARDKVSLSHINNVSPGRSNVHIAPDFTNLLETKLPSRLADLRGSSLIIPNQKMINDENDGSYERYLRFLQLAVEMVGRTGRTPVMLIHEGAQDRRLADEVNKRVSQSILVVDEPSPLVTKAVVSSAELVISSRFHGLINALSAGIPSLACGWSHKYAELMADYDCSRHTIDIEVGESEWAFRLETFLNESEKHSFRDALNVSAKKEKKRSEDMWSQVFSAIDRVAPAAQ